MKIPPVSLPITTTKAVFRQTDGRTKMESLSYQRSFFGSGILHLWFTGLAIEAKRFVHESSSREPTGTERRTFAA
mgnify:CR=1 FL=1